MIDIAPISPSYPVKKPSRVVRERDKQPEQQSSDSEKRKKSEQSKQPQQQHIDEIV